MNTLQTTGSGSEASLVGRIAEDMVRQWRGGARPLAESYLDRFPDLATSPAAVLELLAEELTLRDEYDAPATPDELAARFPAWAAQVRALAECHDALGPHLTPRYPAVGDTLGGYRLVSELGQGAHGRVFVATQLGLGRRVVLKLVPLAGREHLSLARLQHTHIVPLYSAEEFPAHGLRGICMPDFGGRTLSDIGGVPPAEACRVGACLADALGYAHDRGLLHLDVKPSNVLIADDGTPMLLDFHLARAPVAAGAAAPEGLGGTPGFMAPEHAAAMAAVRSGRSLPDPLDARTDVFALGVVLSGLLAARHVSTGLADILARATAADPDSRYPAAADLAADLRRHRADCPLRGVRNRSVVERWQKWRRRRPLSLPLLLLLVLVGVGMAGLGLRQRDAADRASEAGRVGTGHLSRGRFSEAAETFRAGEGLVSGVPLLSDLRTQLRTGRRAAERELAAQHLHAVSEQIRPWYAADFLPTGAAAQVVAACADVWSRRDSIVAALADPEVAPRWRADLLDVAVVFAHLVPRCVPPAERQSAHRRSLAVLDEAERLLGPSAALDLERAAHRAVLGLTSEVPRPAPAPRSPWDHVVVGRAALDRSQLDEASRHFDLALGLAPDHFWANYYAGVCRLRAGRPADSLAAFSACVALVPRGAWCHHNRGLAFAALQQPQLALADFDRALALDPDLGAAHLARSDIHHDAGRHPAALQDLGRALELGLPAAVVEYRKALVLRSANDTAGAIASLRACLIADPDHAAAAVLLRDLSRRP